MPLLPETLSSEIKRPEREADDLLPSNDDFNADRSHSLLSMLTLAAYTKKDLPLPISLLVRNFEFYSGRN